jgi:hypothetical protein
MIIALWNIETCQSHFKKGEEERGRVIEGMN